MMTPTEYTGALMDLGQTRRGIFLEMKYLTPERSTLIYEVSSIHMIPTASNSLFHHGTKVFYCSPKSIYQQKLILSQ